MKKKKTQSVWGYWPQAPKFTASEKAKILSKVKEIIQQLSKMSIIVSRLEMRGNRIYLYKLEEQFQPEGAVYIEPLIDNKYLEFPYARITLHDTKGNNCTVDWQRHNNQWMTLYKGTLTECLNSIENDNCWF